MCILTQLWWTLCDLVDCSPPGSSAHGIFQARILEWVAISSSRGSSWPRDWTQISCVSCLAIPWFLRVEFRNLNLTRSSRGFWCKLVFESHQLVCQEGYTGWLKLGKQCGVKILLRELHSGYIDFLGWLNEFLFLQPLQFCAPQGVPHLLHPNPGLAWNLYFQRRHDETLLKSMEPVALPLSYIILGKLFIYSVRQFFPWENRSNNHTNFTEFAVRNKWNNPCEELSMVPIREQSTGTTGCHTACPMGHSCFPLWESSAWLSQEKFTCFQNTTHS